ncbi:MAG: chemotaxis protein CheX [Acidobacteriota bacterium]|nr:chemotaxis protein CheX [Acidobacteriota bacterium]
MYFTRMLASGQCDTTPECSPDGPPFLTFGLRFTGDVSGCFGLHLEQTTACTLSANFLGQEDSEISACDVGEVVGELTNMLCGSMMSRVKDKTRFVLSHPEPSPLLPVSGVDDVLFCALETDSGVLTVWILVEGRPCLQ